MTWFTALLVAALAVALAFLVLPVVAIFLEVPPGDLLDSLGDPAATDALKLSLQTTLTALVIIIVVGTPSAWLLATRRSPMKRAKTVGLKRNVAIARENLRGAGAGE